MNSGGNLLSIIIFLPLIGVLAILLLCRGTGESAIRNARMAALWTSLVTFTVSLLLWFRFDSKITNFQFVEHTVWLEDFNISYHIGIDGISLFFVLLSTFLIPICILSSWTVVQGRVKEYMISFLILETFMVGMFCALDFVIFYIFFEGVLIPMFLIIGVWGGVRRVYAAFKFFLFTLLGSVLMLLALLVIYLEIGSTSIVQALIYPFAMNVQIWLWLAFFASFAVKIPMWPMHTWLPDAHVEAPTAGSVILAGVLLKMGGYGFLRFSLPMFPEASDFFTPLIFTLSCIAIIYTSLVALVQEDMKKLIAYSSIAHMGFVTIGIFTATHQGITGAIFQMLSHGIASAALFLCVGVVYDRLHTREIIRYGGLVHRMPIYAIVFMIFTLTSIGLPGTSGFIGEFLILLAAFEIDIWVCFFAATGLILSATYMLHLYRRVIFGKLDRTELKKILDLSPREIVIFVPLIGLVLWMGIYPSSFLDPIQASVQNLVDQHQAVMHTIQETTIIETKGR
ncbi:MAG: NADH-quinone oxidoreductase subunit M [Alphaproteobacteria bacterium]|nr:NADH-quinone oxidoreductase subunit M [Alphaproteobacteria bacterium]